MGLPSRVRAATVACLLSLMVAVSATGASAGAEGPGCLTVTASPGFERDHQLFCVAASDTAGNSSTVWTSHDAGRSWRALRQMTANPAGAQGLLVSPLYPTDHTVIMSGSSFWASKDSGRTWAEDPTAGSHPVTSMSPVIAHFPDDPPAGHLALLIAQPGSALGGLLYDLRLGVVNTLGGPTYTNRYYPHGGWPNYEGTVAVAYEPRVATDGLYSSLKSFGCVSLAACPLARQDFGAGFATGFGRLGATDYMTVFDTAPPRIYRSVDGGLTWARWSDAERAARSTGQSDLGQAITIAGGAQDHPHRLFMLTADNDMTGLPPQSLSVPAEVLLASDNDGRTWQRIAAGWSYRQHRAGTLPWNSAGLSEEAIGGSLTVLPGNRLLVPAGHRSSRGIDYQGLYCSRDSGRHWSTHCS